MLRRSWQCSPIISGSDVSRIFCFLLHIIGGVWIRIFILLLLLSEVIRESLFDRQQNSSGYLKRKAISLGSFPCNTTILNLRMVEKACVKRLQKEYRALCKEPVSHVVARPAPNDILEWHYVLEGSEGTPFAGGYYYGKIKFPPEYPFKPPGISMTTPNGRFMTQKKICLSMSDFHPESWNPMWSVSSILTGLLSFMMDKNPTTGSVTTTVTEKQKLAKASLAFNCKNSTFRKLFPEYVEKYEHQKLFEQPVIDRVSNLAENNGPLLDENGNPTREEMNRMEPQKEVKSRWKQYFPTWVLLLLASIFGVVMALPLLQL